MIRIVLLVAAAAMIAVMVTVSAAPALAAEPPAGSADTCPPGYQAMTLEDQLAQAKRLGVPEDDARNLFSRINKNQDAWICQKKLPGGPLSYNFIDNQALGLDKS